MKYQEQSNSEGQKVGEWLPGSRKREEWGVTVFNRY